MNEATRPAVPPALTMRDVLYVIFRHKWKIVVISLIGLIAACALPMVLHPMYQSEAKLLIKYVEESKSPVQIGPNQSTVQAVDDSSQSIINTELEILTSMDLALEVADAIGPEKILSKVGGEVNRNAAAGFIQSAKHLTAEAPKKSNVIRIAFQHPDPEIARAVLSQLIESYIKKHAEIHRGGGFDEFLAQETDQLRSRLQQTEEELRNAKNRAGVISLEQAKKAYAEQIVKLRDRILDAQAEVAERQAALSREVEPTAKRDDTVASTNDVPISQEKVADYQKVRELLTSLRAKERDLLMIYTPASALVTEVHARVVEAEARQRQLEQETPQLVKVKVPEPARASAEPSSSGRSEADAEADAVRVSGLLSKISVLTNQLADVQARLTKIEEAEPAITELQRRRDLDEQRYTNFSASLDQSHIVERLGAGKISNISAIQAPSPPSLLGSKLRKMMVMVVFGAIAGGVGLAFLIELFWDQTLKRASDIETKIGLPLFINIPRLAQQTKSQVLGKAHRMPLLADKVQSGESDPNPGDEAIMVEGNGQSGPANGAELEPWHPSHALGPFSEALRDRLITWFELKNLTHKPKLVAVTSCAENSGVSSVAAGLAASLSETGEGNVLLVDMNEQNGAAHHFHKGDLACGIVEALERGKRGEALVHEKLYMVSESTNREKLPAAFPSRFKNLVPKLKASDFDYIIFDMPPVNQISVTPRLARFMDLVLMVVESEKADRTVVKQATAMLGETKTPVGVVLNKSKSYVPRWLLAGG